MTIDYMMLSRHHTYELVSAVKEKIEQGWLPQGGVGVNSDSKYYRYSQAMIKEVDEEI